MVDKNIVNSLNEKWKGRPIEEILHFLAVNFEKKVVFTTSFGIEDQVITDYIFRNDIPVKVITLDTGRLFEETYKVYNRTIEKYKKTIVPYFPRHEAVEKLLQEKGPLSFYLSPENRRECCNIRKVEPLGRALEGMEIWVTGLRASQSDNRSTLSLFNWDEGFRIIKCNPLLDWSLDECTRYVKENNVPYNVLHDRGFVSIGCAPCTRAIKPGEDFRAGRWWWENNSKKECGLHTHQ
ncbi:MAG: phosphoadenylyl-sulfate reductase [Prolixibacteraceae bacterium]|jgi:phosphoadenosine phosphosulfate reductase|nr:phosphoadenylyl-sulfate reductase [Prolixibacteraceae bacterium]